MWLVDGNTELVHFVSSSVGSTKIQPNTNTGISRYTSTILSFRNNSNGVCMDAVLIATQSQPDWRPEVICRGSREQHIAEYGDTMKTPLPEIRDRSVILKHAIDELDLILPGNKYATQILVCHSSSGKASWLKEGTVLTAFTNGSITGDFIFHLHPIDSSIVLWEAVVLEITEQHITTALFYTDQYDVGSYTISCTSDQDSALATVNILSTSTVVTSTNYYTELSTWQQLRSEGSTATTEAARILVSSCKYVIYLVVCLAQLARSLPS